MLLMGVQGITPEKLLNLQMCIADFGTLEFRIVVSSPVYINFYYTPEIPLALLGTLIIS